MLPFPTLIIIERSADTPVYQQIANKLVTLIRDGIIQPGAPLPGSREMAELLQVHRKTVVAAYAELDAQDWIESIPRKGVFVSRHLPEIKPRSFNALAASLGYGGKTGFHFRQAASIPPSAGLGNKIRLVITDGQPDSRLAPMDGLMRVYKQLLGQRNYRRFLGQGGYAGTPLLRQSITRFLADTRGITVDTPHVLITRGAQMAIYIAARLMVQPGDYVMVGEPNYFVADKVFEEAGARLLRIPVDENGIDVDAVEALCKTKKIRMLYIIPHHHHPTTVTLSMDRRMKLLDIIRQYNLAVIEDDYDYDFHYSTGPILPLASAGHGGNVIYIGSLTKSMATSIRVGYMIAPADFIVQAANLRRLIDIRGDGLMEDALAMLINNGDFLRHLRKSNKVYCQRRDAVCDAMTRLLGDAVSFCKPDGGMAVWTQFNAAFPLPQIAARAAAMGLSMSDGSYYNLGKGRYNALRIGFASLNEKEMEESMEIIKKSMDKIRERET